MFTCCDFGSAHFHNCPVIHSWGCFLECLSCVGSCFLFLHRDTVSMWSACPSISVFKRHPNFSIIQFVLLDVRCCCFVTLQLWSHVGKKRHLFFWLPGLWWNFPVSQFWQSSIYRPHLQSLDLFCIFRHRSEGVGPKINWRNCRWSPRPRWEKTYLKWLNKSEINNCTWKQTARKNKMKIDHNS